MKTKNRKVLSKLVSVLVLIGLVAWGLIFMYSRGYIFADISTTSGGMEICDNRIDDNRNGLTDECWDPGNNYKPTGTIYYVSKATNASDSNPGTQASPFKTINKATSVAKAGDGIYVGAGDYAEDVVFTNAGTPSQPILLKGIGSSRESVVISKSTDWTSTGFVAIEPKSNTIIQNLSTDGKFSVTNSGHNYGGYGIYLHNNVENVYVQNVYMTTHDTPIRAESGSRLIVRDVLAEKNELGFTIGVSTNTGSGSEFDNSLWENVESRDTTFRTNNDGWASEGTNTYHVFRNCKAHGWYDAGFDLKSHVIIENSLAYDNDEQGYKIWRDGIIRNSIAYDNGRNNFLFGGLKPGGTVNMNYQMVGNVSYGGRVLFEKTDETDTAISPSRVKLSHNIFYNTEITDQVGGIFTNGDHNLFYGGSSPTSKGANSLTSDPKFMSATTKDFRLMDTSPAIDAGSASLTQYMSAIDYDKNPRLSGSAVDIGAFEVQKGDTQTPQPTPTPGGTANDTVTPPPTRTVTQTVTQTTTRTATQTTTPTIDTTQNRPPYFVSSPNRSVKQGYQLKFQVIAKDPNGSSVKFSAVSLPGGNAQITSGGVFSWTPRKDQSGSYSAVIKAMDPQGAWATQTLAIKVLKGVNYLETRWVNYNVDPADTLSFQVCRRSTYSAKYTEIFTFGDSSPYMTINESGRSGCSNFYQHIYEKSGQYQLSLYLCEKNTSGELVNCFPNVVKNIIISK